MTAQDELDFEVSESPRMTEADVTAALHVRYSQVHGNGRRYAVAAGVRSHAGFDARRTADYVAMDLWPSKGLALHGHEIKVSRSDWLRELKEPEKAAEFIPYMNYWWLVASDPRIVRDGELPKGWGLMVMRGPLLTVAVRAPRRDAQPMMPSRLAALLRAVAQTSAYLERRDHERRYRCHSVNSKCGTPAPPAGFPPERLAELVICGCTQVPELGPCEHQRAAGTGAA
jgi:hypothetical protein